MTPYTCLVIGHQDRLDDSSVCNIRVIHEIGQAGLNAHKAVTNRG
jgi:hypothetical protein